MKERILKNIAEIQVSGKSTIELYNEISSAVMREISFTAPATDKKSAYYLSIEFLIGRMFYNNLLELDILHETEEILKAKGADISLFETIEDAALGNGGLGRLAACFIDSAAGLNLPVYGRGIRYKYGLFKQKFEDGFQEELPKDIKDYFFLIGVILVLVVLFIIQNLVNSRSGRAITSTRDNRIAAESIGIDITKYKLKAFAISAALAGIGGVLYAHNLATLTALPKNFGYNMSIMFLVFVVLGGIGNMRGSIIAAVILNLLPELLRGLSDYRMLFYAIVLIVMMLINWAPKAIEMRERLFSKFKKKEA